MEYDSNKNIKFEILNGDRQEEQELDPFVWDCGAVG